MSDGKKWVRNKWVTVTRAAGMVRIEGRFSEDEAGRILKAIFPGRAATPGERDEPEGRG